MKEGRKTREKGEDIEDAVWKKDGGRRTSGYHIHCIRGRGSVDERRTLLSESRSVRIWELL